MLFVAGVFALLAGQAAAQACNCPCKLDDCFSVLAGPSPFPAEVTVSDCRSFMWTVITIAAETITTTEVVTETTTDTVEATSFTTITATTSVPLLKRQATGVDIPPYATAACPQPSDFSSACACIGVTGGGTSYHHIPGTSTVTTTRTVTATEEETVTVPATETAVATNVHFKIRAANVAENGIFAGQYWYVVDEGGRALQRVTFVNNVNQGLVFRAGPDNNILSDTGIGFAADTALNQAGEQLYLQEPIEQESVIPCTFSPGDKGVTCGYTGEGTNYIYLVARSSGALWLYRNQADIVGDAVGPLVIEAVPI